MIYCCNSAPGRNPLVGVSRRMSRGGGNDTLLPRKKMKIDIKRITPAADKSTILACLAFSIFPPDTRMTSLIKNPYSESGRKDAGRIGADATARCFSYSPRISIAFMLHNFFREDNASYAQLHLLNTRLVLRCHSLTSAKRFAGREILLICTPCIFTGKR